MSLSKPYVLILAGAALGACVLGNQLSPSAVADARGGGIKDVTVCRLTEMQTWGTSNGIAAYSLGTTALNNGNVDLAWLDSGSESNRHPVIAQNIYRLKDGRFEQIGQSWLKHGWCAADASSCGPNCDSEWSCDWLGPGCGDTYNSSHNGAQNDLGPRSEVNPWTGEFNFPHDAPTGNNTIKGRIQVQVDDVDPDLNDGALYFGEGHYVHPDETDPQTKYNNASWRRILVGNQTSGTYDLEFQGSDPTHITEPAIFAWKAFDPSVSLIHVQEDRDGRFHVGWNVTDNGDGTWHYEYAVFNLNSERAAQAFSVAVPDGVNITNIGFHGMPHHSGEPFATDDWTAAVADGAITWSTDSFAVDENANALRWSNMYNFRFDADREPEMATGALQFFKTGPTDSLDFQIEGPKGIDCPGDLAGGNNAVDVFDLLELLANWGTDGSGAALAAPNDTVDVFDLLSLLGAWGTCL